MIPNNVTTFLDSEDWPTIAIFPWTSESCAQAYLDHLSTHPAGAVFTFLPDLSITVVPDASNSSWSLGGNNSWQESWHWPTLAFTAASMQPILTEMSYYSGNMSDAPYGPNLTENYGSYNLPRLFAQFTVPIHKSFGWPVGGGITGGILFLLVVGMLYTWTLRWQRMRSFQRRLERGEIDLEALGIKKTNVPQKVIDEMPLFTFTASSPISKPGNVADPAISLKQEDGLSTPFATPRSAAEMFSQSSQTTCPVCLDDFANGETSVRELPCKHIFHPECIDLYLRDTSSLCPMCKKSALPLGYCPVKITHFMVEHERSVREQRLPSASSFGTRHAARGSTFAPGPGAPLHGDVEMTAIDSDSQVTLAQEINQTGPHNVPAEVTHGGVAARRAWHRERLAQQQEQVFAAASENVRRTIANRPRWRRIVQPIAPGTS